MVASFPFEVFAPRAGPAGKDTPGKPLCQGAFPRPAWLCQPSPCSASSLQVLPGAPAPGTHLGMLCRELSPFSRVFWFLDLTRFRFRGGLKLSQSLPKSCLQRSSAVCPTGCTGRAHRFLCLMVIARASSEFWKANRNIVLMLG